MFRIDTGRPSRYCDGLTRRSFVQLGMAGLASVPLSRLLRAKEQSVTAGNPDKDTSTILIWLDGGPSHMDTYDMKPLAPEEYRGIWKPIQTNVPGIEVTEMFPQHARHADKFSIIRSVHHNQQDHFSGGHYMLTGRGGASGGNKSIKFPSIGSIAAKFAGDRRPGFPSYVSVPVASTIGLRPGYFGAHFLGRHRNPFQTGGDPNNENFSVNDLTRPLV